MDQNEGGISSRVKNVGIRVIKVGRWMQGGE